MRAEIIWSNICAFRSLFLVTFETSFLLMFGSVLGSILGLFRDHFRSDLELKMFIVYCNLKYIVAMGLLRWIQKAGLRVIQFSEHFLCILGSSLSSKRVPKRSPEAPITKPNNGTENLRFFNQFQASKSPVRFRNLFFFGLKLDEFYTQEY